MTIRLDPIYLSNSQLFKVSVFDADGVTEITPQSCVCSIWNVGTGAAVLTNQAGAVGAGYAQYNWSGSATAGNFEAVLTVSLSPVVVKSEHFLVEVLSKPPVYNTILTPIEAANCLRCEPDDQVMLQMLPMLDVYLENATGHDWASDATISDTAKAAAGMLLIAWYDHPEMVGSSPTSLVGLLVQLEAEALKFQKYEFEGLSGGGSIYLPGAREGAAVVKVQGVTTGLTGDQSAKFESVISASNYLVQTSTDDLDEKFFVVVLKHAADDVSG
jgi:hypothetical protein